MAGLRLSRLWVALLAVGVVAVSLPAVAAAAFPGRNGRIAYHHWRDNEDNVPPFGPAVVRSTVESVLPSGKGHRRLLGPFRPERRWFAGLAFSPRGRKLALAFGPYHRRSSLYLMAANGRGRLRRLTRSRPGQLDISPAWAADGRQLAFTRSSGGSTGIRVYRAGSSREISEQQADSLAWSVRRRIAFANEPGGSAASEPSIYTMRPNGSHVRRVVERGGDPDWSPNGRWIVYTLPGWLGGLGPAPPSPSLYRTSIAMVRSDGSRLRVLTDHDGGREPAFSPDGKYIVFLRFDDAGRRHTVLVMRLRDGRTRKIAAAPPDGEVPGTGRHEVHALYSPTWQPLPRGRQR
jgi:Tol biopolymer transport system component